MSALRLRNAVAPLAAAVLVALFLIPAAAQAAGPPVVTATAVLAVTETSATLSATVDPTGGSTRAHFDFTTLAEFEEHGFEGATRLPAEASEDFPVPSGAPKSISTPLTGLTPATGYVFRAVAKKTGGAHEEGESPSPTTFYTFGPAPTFGPCPNDEFRSGALAAPGAPGSPLPDCRSFEMATPVNKNGNNALSAFSLARAADDGSAITYGSNFGIPGGQGSQRLPFYQASRGAEDWTTTGLLPPASLGEEGRFLVGQLPDLSATYATVTKLDAPIRSALFELHRDGSPPLQITPFAPGGADNTTKLGFAGASADASTLVVQAAVALPSEDLGPPIPQSSEAGPNVYAWSRESGQLQLASVMNSEAETKAKLPKGSWAGPYDWASGQLATNGGTEGAHYLADQHAVSGDGSVFFTSRSDGNLYERLNPTQPQSAMETVGGEELCSEPAKACTLDVSGSQRPKPDPGGPQPAAFQTATADGSKVFFTSSEKLTADANTGPDQPPAQIGTATPNGEDPVDTVVEDFLPAHALGVGVDPKGEYIYWVEPLKGTIGRANLKAPDPKTTVDPEFIVPGEGTCPQVVKEVEVGPGEYEPVFEDKPIPSEPRYVAADEEHVYWTNTGRRNGNGNPIEGGGTIGRATLKADGSGAEDIRPDFLCGAGTPPADQAKKIKPLVSDPQGIAVDSGHVYWANSNGESRGIGRAELDGGDPEERFVAVNQGGLSLYGIAVDAGHIYFAANNNSNNASNISRVPLEGGEQELAFIGEAGLRGVAVDTGHVYWTTQGEGGAIGRLSLADFDSCPPNPNCDNHFLTPAGTLEGLATDGTHLFWSVNGESPGNPGNDLYRFEAATKTLTDLAPKDSNESPNGAEVRGVLGTSADGSYVYFAANGDLDGAGPAEQGDCTGKTFNENKGECSIYLYHDLGYEFIARVTTTHDYISDSYNWLPAGDRSGINTKQKASWVSADGRTLVFRSVRALTPYDNHGEMELYRFTVGDDTPTCLTCTPSGEAPISRPSYSNLFTGSQKYSGITPDPSSAAEIQLRLGSTDGARVVFETPESLVSADTDGGLGCKLVEAVPTCLDVYEWEAPGKGSCSAGGPGYSPLNQGCIYLISQDSDSGPAYFADASASGDDVFFFTSSQLVRQDSDELLDVYDARVGGGLSAQNPHPIPPCEAECKPGATPPPGFQAPPRFQGPPNPKPPKACPKGKVRKHGRCVKKANKHKKKPHRQHKRADAKRGAGR